VNRENPMKEQRPWRQLRSLPFAVDFPSMMRKEELLVLYSLSRDIFTGRGVIVDAGSFLGSSTKALGSGLRDNRRVEHKQKRIHSYDMFICNEFMAPMLEPYGIRAGDSFRSLFDRHIHDLAEMIEVHDGDIRQSPEIEEPVEIYLCDISKNASINSYLFRHHFRRLIPGVSILVHQDFVFTGCPWIMYNLEYLWDHFEVVDLVAPSLVLRYTSPIPDEKIVRICEDRFSSVEKLALLEGLRGRFQGDAELMIDLVAARLAEKHGMVHEYELRKERILKQGFEDAAMRRFLEPLRSVRSKGAVGKERRSGS